MTQIAAQYPGARFLWTHRDPAVTIPSTCSVVRTAQEGILPSRRRDPSELGGFILDHYIEGIGLATTARDALGEDIFFDVDQHDLDTRPLETVERIYDFLALTLDDGVRAHMLRWSTENRRGSRGEHTYQPEDYGLTTESIRAAFRDYTERFAGVAGSLH
jgi:hypothetical protein